MGTAELTLESLGLDQDSLATKLVDRLAQNMLTSIGYDADGVLWIEDLVANGLIEPADEAEQPPAFHLCCVLTVKTARRLRDDFQLDRHGVALALTLVRRIRELQAELGALRARFGHPG